MKILHEVQEFLIRRHEQACYCLHNAEESLKSWKASDDVRVRGMQIRFWEQKVSEHVTDCEYLEHMINLIDKELGE